MIRLQTDFLRPLVNPLADATRILDEAVAEHHPSHVFAMFSGGHDSLCATAIAAKHPKFSGAVHVNTGIGIERTREFVRESCTARGWPLNEYRSPITYESIVRKFGFPGPSLHGLMYTRLKERCVRQLIREHKQSPRDRILLVTGVRRAESIRRMGVLTEINRIGAAVWTACIINWTDEDKRAFMTGENLPRNPIVDQLCMSGECLCGAFAHPGERAEIREVDPVAFAEIERLEKIAAQCGHDWKWGERPPRRAARDVPGQQRLELCASCEWKHSIKVEGASGEREQGECVAG